MNANFLGKISKRVSKQDQEPQDFLVAYFGLDSGGGSSRDQ